MIEHKYKKEIAAEYGLKPRTFHNRLKRYHLIVPRGLVSPRDQKRVYERLGYPIGVNEDDFARINCTISDTEI